MFLLPRVGLPVYDPAILAHSGTSRRLTHGRIFIEHWRVFRSSFVYCDTGLWRRALGLLRRLKRFADGMPLLGDGSEALEHSGVGAAMTEPGGILQISSEML
jgi:hypothetical protein